MHHEHEIVRLGDVCEFVRGVTFRAAEAHDLPMPGFVPILRAGNIGDGLDLENDLLWVPSSRVRPEQYLQPGDIAVCLSSGSPRLVGKSAQLKEPFVGAVGAFCGIVRPAKSICGDYIAHWLRSPDFVEWRDSQARGVNIQNLRFSQFEKIRLPLPTLSEQKRIVAALEEQLVELDSARAAAKAQLEATQALPGALLREVFDSSETKEWPTKTLNEVSVINPRRPKIDRSDSASTSFVPMESVSINGAGIAEMQVRPYGKVRKGYTYFEEGDVLFAKITPCMQNGKHAIARDLIDGFGFGSTEFHVLRASNEVLPEWIHCFLSRPPLLQQATSFFTGSVGQQRLPKDYLANLKLPLPSLDRQKNTITAIKERFAEVDRTHLVLESQLHQLNLLAEKLLEAAFSGQSSM
jgi:type I restriction enzyme S subunit